MSLISIITAVYNNKQGLKLTLDSVLSQKGVSIELIVIDGGSTDGTVDVIKDYANYIDYWVSESDNGVFDAMNKGISNAKGDWLLFLNSGDTLYHGCLLKIDFSELINYGILYGNTLIGDIIEYPYDINFDLIYLIACHQSMFFNREFLNGELYYDHSFKLLADTDLFMRIMKRRIPIFWVDVIVSKYEGGGLSSFRNFSSVYSRVQLLLRYGGVLGLLKYILFKLGLKSIIDTPKRIR